MLTDLRQKREQGFTLIELLVVILIIGILAAIAVPMFLNQKKAAIDASVVSDVRNAQGPIGTWISKQGTAETPVPADWTTDFQGSKAADTGAYKDIKVMLSNGTIMRITGTSYNYVITANNPNGDQSSASNGGVSYDSKTGKLVTGTASASASPTAGPTTATCGGGTYTVTGGGATIACVLGSGSGGTTMNYTITVTTNSATPVQWAVNADWTGVNYFKSASGYAAVAFDNIAPMTTKTYTFTGTDRSWNHDPTASNDYQYISSSKSPIVFTAQIMTTQ